jgi:hypothetical protein
LTGKGSGKRGRPLGFRLSAYSKMAISMSKTGQKHKQETKDKISRSLVQYFRRKNPWSEEIIDRYCRSDNDNLCEWVMEVQEELDNAMDVLTDKAMRNKSKIELACGPNIEFFSHNLTPELLIMCKEYCEETGQDLYEFIDKHLTGGGNYVG